ncbi:hypothetical protein [Rhizobium sp. PAMB 3182]
MAAALRTIETEGDRLEREAREALEEFVTAARESAAERARINANLRRWDFLFTDPKDPPPPL